MDLVEISEKKNQNLSVVPVSVSISVTISTIVSTTVVSTVSTIAMAIVAIVSIGIGISLSFTLLTAESLNGPGHIGGGVSGVSSNTETMVSVPVSSVVGIAVVSAIEVGSIGIGSRLGLSIGRSLSAASEAGGGEAESSHARPVGVDVGVCWIAVVAVAVVGIGISLGLGKSHGSEKNSNQKF